MHQVKQLASIPLLLFYLLVSIGVPITVHYCGGEIEEVAVMQSDISCCCEELTEHSCCGNEGYFVNLDTDQYVQRVPEFVPVMEVVAVHGLALQSPDAITEAEEMDQVPIDRPPPQKPPLWLAHCSLTYYG